VTPPLRQIDRDGMHRLISSRFSDVGTVLDDRADDDDVLEKIIRLDGATNDRIQGEQFGLPGISTYELVYGIPKLISFAQRTCIPVQVEHNSPTQLEVLGTPATSWKRHSPR
jgi:hypothetical protein